MDNQPNEENKNSNENNKKTSQGSNFFWYLIALGLLLLVFMTFRESQSSIAIDWSDFEQLAKECNPQDKEQDGAIEITREVNGEDVQYKLSQLDKIVVGFTSVTGKVDRLLVPTESEEGTEQTEPPETETVSFVVNWNPAMPKPGEMLDKYNIEYKGASGPNPMLEWIPTLIMMGLFIAIAIFMIRRIGGAGSPMAFGRSRGKLYAQEDLEVTFDDVAGIEEAVEELREVVDFLKNPERYQRLGGRIPKGVLLVGPPGTGKTLLSKAVAGEAGVPFFSLSGSDFVEMFVGVGAARVRDMFQQAEQRAPCIVFIDELDALGKTRGNGAVGSHDEREQTLNALLVEMDGFGTNSGIIVMAATNRPETLDPALMRPGRFDRHVLVDRPDVSGREHILDVHLQKIKVDADVDVKALAGITSGFVGADLANMVNEAALLAARNGKEVVGKEEFYEAVERASIGLEKKSRIILDEEKQRLAVHEAGHALVAYSLPNTDPVHKVSIIPRGLSALGYMQQRPEHDRYMITKTQLESRIQVMLGGTLAEELILDDIGSGASNDLDRATEVARSMVMDYGMSRLGRVTYRERTTNFLGDGSGMPMQHHSEQTAREIDQEVKRIIEEALEQTRRILSSRRPALEAITSSLLEHEVIDAEQLADLIDHSSPEPKIVPGTHAERKADTASKSDNSSNASNESAGG